MRRTSDQDFIQGMLVMAMIAFSMFSFLLAKSMGAPWAVSIKFMFAALVIFIIYCIYAWIRYGLMGSSIQASSCSYNYTLSWYHYIRVWPFTLLLIFISSFEMLDTANTVSYMGFLSKPKNDIFFDSEKAWYALWYSKLLISIAIVVVGHVVHHTCINWLRNLFN